MDKPIRILRDNDADTLTLDNITYSQELFRQLGGLMPVGQTFRLVVRSVGIYGNTLTIEKIDPPASIRDVVAERQRQVSVEGWTPEHDDEHDTGCLAAAGSSYALYAADEMNPYSQGDGGYGSAPPEMWPFRSDWWKPEDPRRALVKAGALILAEIDRIDRSKVTP